MYIHVHTQRRVKKIRVTFSLCLKTITKKLNHKQIHALLTYSTTHITTKVFVFVFYVLMMIILQLLLFLFLLLLYVKLCEQHNNYAWLLFLPSNYSSFFFYSNLLFIWNNVTQNFFLYFYIYIHRYVCMNINFSSIQQKLFRVQGKQITFFLFSFIRLKETVYKCA